VRSVWPWFGVELVGGKEYLVFGIYSISGAVLVAAVLWVQLGIEVT